MTARRRNDPAEADIAVALTARLDTVVQEIAAIAESPPEPEKPKVKTCDIKNLLSASVLELLKSFPQNPTVRSMVASQLKQPLPDDKATYEQVVEWVEYNPEFAKQPPKAPSYLIIPISESGTETGMCRYTTNTYGTQDFQLSDAQLLEIAKDSAESGDSFWELLNTHISESYEINMEYTGDEQTDRHEPRDDDRDGWEWLDRRASQALIRDRVTKLDRDLADEITW